MPGIVRAIVLMELEDGTQVGLDVDVRTQWSSASIIREGDPSWFAPPLDQIAANPHMRYEVHLNLKGLARGVEMRMPDREPVAAIGPHRDVIEVTHHEITRGE